MRILPDKRACGCLRACIRAAATAGTQRGAQSGVALAKALEHVRGLTHLDLRGAWLVDALWYSTF